MLETLRQYALARLGADDEQQDVQRRHCDDYLELAEHVVARLSTRDEPQAMATLGTAIDNLRSALQWALGSAPPISLRLAGQLGAYWRLRYDLEGLQWLDASPRSGAASRRALARAARRRRRSAHQRKGMPQHSQRSKTPYTRGSTRGRPEPATVPPGAPLFREARSLCCTTLANDDCRGHPGAASLDPGRRRHLPVYARSQRRPSG
jgi:hypothetical protein